MYTATAHSVDDMVYHRDDSKVCIRPDLLLSPWRNNYLLFLENPNYTDDPIDVEPDQENDSSHDANDSGDSGEQGGSASEPSRGDSRLAPRQMHRAEPTGKILWTTDVQKTEKAKRKQARRKTKTKA